MTYTIKIEKEAQKFINKQDKNQQARLYNAIYNLPNRRHLSYARQAKQKE